MFGLAGDDLSVVLFYLGLAVTFAGTAISIAGWKHRALIAGLFILAVAALVVGGAWPWIKEISPAATATIKSIGTSPVAWFAVFMFLVAVFVFHRPRPRGREIVTPTGGADYDDNELRQYINDLQQQTALLAAKTDRGAAEADALRNLERTAFLLVHESNERREYDIIESLLLRLPTATGLAANDESIETETNRLTEFINVIRSDLTQTRWRGDFATAMQGAANEVDHNLKGAPAGVNPYKFRAYQIALRQRDWAGIFLKARLDDIAGWYRSVRDQLKERINLHKR